MGPSQLWCLLLLLTVHLVDGAGGLRRLHKERDWGDIGDPSGLGGLIAARAASGSPPRPPQRTAVTPEAAESSANAVFNGIFRSYNSMDTRTYAKAENMAHLNEKMQSTKDTIRPRARSAIDVFGLRKTPNLGSGEEQMSALATGPVALAETFEGAESIAASNSIAMNTGIKGRDKTTIAASMLTSKPQPYKSVDRSKTRSFGVTSNNGVKSLALSGVANGRVVIAQAESAVAASQTQSSKADQWQDPDLGRRLLQGR